MLGSHSGDHSCASSRDSSCSSLAEIRRGREVSFRFALLSPTVPPFSHLDGCTPCSRHGRCRQMFLGSLSKPLMLVLLLSSRLLFRCSVQKLSQICRDLFAWARWRGRRSAGESSLPSPSSMVPSELSSQSCARRQRMVEPTTESCCAKSAAPAIALSFVRAVGLQGGRSAAALATPPPGEVLSMANHDRFN